ncbi:hypothetical protein PCANC_24157 [Puccinia coronata f. sp. avenae]|uniref:Uncharacterized protein n=1 Tax=Puccinia coronata f. sp. avenae TaxID=200324 RepID=A0A2N5TXZ6_9BASI|nr:hypothetical protein PCANC_24157 [Puccinia coronata f. sp. avenae]
MPGLKCKAVTSKDGNTEQAICASLYWTILHTIGKCNLICSGCGALHWREESTLDQRNSETIHFSACCQKGKVTIPSAADDTPAFPPMLKKLFVGQSKRVLNFQALICNYNNALSFTSQGAKLDHLVMGPMGINVFHISGIMSHKIPSVKPNNWARAGFAQIFVVGNHGTAEAQYRVSFAQGKREGASYKLMMDLRTVKQIMNPLYNINPYAKVYMNARQMLAGQDTANLALIACLMGLSNTASDKIVRCYAGQACQTGLSNMGMENSVRCRVEQTWFNGFVRHGIRQLCPIPCQTTVFDEFVQHGIKQAGDLLGKRKELAEQVNNLLGKELAEQVNDLLGEELAEQVNDLLGKELAEQVNDLLANSRQACYELSGL